MRNLIIIMMVMGLTSQLYAVDCPKVNVVQTAVKAVSRYNITNSGKLDTKNDFTEHFKTVIGLAISPDLEIGNYVFSDTFDQIVKEGLFERPLELASSKLGEDSSCSYSIISAITDKEFLLGFTIGSKNY